VEEINLIKKFFHVVFPSIVAFKEKTVAEKKARGNSEIIKLIKMFRCVFMKNTFSSLLLIK
jgi:hypothetical protein